MTTHVSRRVVTHGGQSITKTDQSLENNLDALLEDLQTSISRSATPSRGARGTSPQVEYMEAITPTHTTHTTTEKFVSTGAAGMPSGIPGLEILDKELQDVQPGQSKTVAYKQVSYHYNKNLNENPMDSWKMSENVRGRSSSSLRNYEERSHKRERSPELVNRINKELLYGDITKSSSRQASPLPSGRKEVYHHETSYRSEPKTVPTILRNESSAENYLLSSSSLPAKSVEKTITYTVPVDCPADKTVTYQVEKINENSGYKRPASPVRYITTSTPEKTIHKEAKYYREERNFRTESPLYAPSPNFETKSSLSRNERFSDIGYGPRGPGDFGTDHSTEKTTVIYQNQVPPPRINETTRTTTIDRVLEERYMNDRSPVNYYATAPVNASPSLQHKTTVYNHEIHMSKPYPRTNGTTVVDGPPKKLEDLMASFSETEKEVLQDIARREKTITTKTNTMTKKEVDFVDGPDKKVTASPVYYPPGYELSRKEESMSQSSGGGGWAKSKAKYEYESSAKEKEKKKTRKGVVPVCLPLCCALPCTIM